MKQLSNATVPGKKSLELKDLLCFYLNERKQTGVQHQPVSF